MPIPSEPIQADPWINFFRRIHELAAQLDAQEAEAEEDRE